MNLTGPQRQTIKKALLDALSGGMNALEQVVDTAFSTNVYTFLPHTASFDQAVYEVIKWADARTPDHVLRLIAAASDVNPDNDKLKASRAIIALAIGEQPADSASYQNKSQGQLERILHKAADIADVVNWRKQMDTCEAAVCRIEVPAKIPEGTGFLIAPNLVITNYHVFKRVWNGDIAPADVACRFDFKTGEDGVSVMGGRACALAADWEVAKGGEADDELDFALIRLADSPGDDALQNPAGAKRSWLKPLEAPLKQGDPLCILQHPLGKPLALSFAEIQQVPADQNYLVHDVNTEEGSSGSPCFDAQWHLVALHYYGKYAGNRALPFGPILKQIQQYLPLTANP